MTTDVPEKGEVEKGDLIAEAIVEALGERCPDFEPECLRCQTWAQFDALTALAERLAEAGAALRPFVEYVPDEAREGNGRFRLVAIPESDGGGGWLGAEDFRRARAFKEKYDGE